MRCGRPYEPAQAHHLLNLSFAQYQADQAVVRIEARIDRQQVRLERLRSEATCERGDVEEYRRLRAEVQESRRDRRSAAPGALDRTYAALTRLAPGDVVVVDGARLAVLSVAFRKGNPRLHVVDERSKPRTIGADELSEPPRALGSVEMPVPYNPNNRAFQHKVGESLRRARLERRDHGKIALDDPPPSSVDDAYLAAESHPVADCPDRDAHVRSAVQAERVDRELHDLRRQVRGRTESLARRFDRVLRLLEAWGYLEDWALTDAGEVLARTYHEADLLVAEAMITGILDDLDAPSLAALASCFTYEHRGRERPPAPQYPSSTVRDRFQDLERIWGDLSADEEAAGLPVTRAPDPGFVHLAHAWAAGGGLASVLEDQELSGGDFVRNVKQLIDLLRGISDVAPVAATAARARQAADALQRGVVTATSSLEIEREPEGIDDDPQG
jgi:ATP-dependent RNA helicase HelY